MSPPGCRRAAIRTPTRRRGSLALAVVIVFAVPLQALAQVPTPVDPDAGRCAVPNGPIGTITVERLDIFEPDAAGVTGLVERSANALHPQTWERVIRRYLLFRPGDACADEALAQTERNLRATGIFQKVEVLSSPGPGGTVDVHVRARDAWTLRVNGDYRRVGGVSAWEAGLTDLSVAGSGIGIGIGHRSQFEADVTTAWFDDRRFLGSHERLSLRTDRRSDGRANAASLVRPFDSLASRWGHEVSFAETRDRLRLYENGIVTDEYDRRAEDGVAGVAVRIAQVSASSVWRLAGGFRFTAREYGTLEPEASVAAEPPPSHRWAGPYLNLHFVEHRFIKRTGIFVPGRDADFNLGTEFTVSSFVSGRIVALDSTPRAAVGGGASHGWLLGQHGLLTGSAAAGGQFGGSEPARGNAGGVLRAWWQLSPTRIRAFLVEANALVNPDSGSRYYLGGSPGLRGYRQYALTGTRSVLAIAEERKYFDWTLLRTFQFGVAGFAEAGAVGGVPGRPGTTLAVANVGAGLRIAQLRAAVDTAIRIDVAFPLVAAPDGTRRPQFVIGYRGDY